MDQKKGKWIIDCLKPKRAFPPFICGFKPASLKINPIITSRWKLWIYVQLLKKFVYFFSPKLEPIVYESFHFTIDVQLVGGKIDFSTFIHLGNFPIRGETPTGIKYWVFIVKSNVALV